MGENGGCGSVCVCIAGSFEGAFSSQLALRTGCIVFAGTLIGLREETIDELMPDLIRYMLTSKVHVCLSD